MEVEQYYTIKEIAQLFKCSIKTIRRYIWGNQLDATLIGGHYKIKKSELQRFISESKKYTKRTKDSDIMK